jgi:hypothetical protein
VRPISKYLLLIDPKKEVLNLQVTALGCFYGGIVHSTTDPMLALEILQTKGSPDMIVVDASMLGLIESENHSCPVIATSFLPINDDLMRKYPSLTAMIEKPLTALSFSHLIKKHTITASISPPYIPVSLSILLKLGMGHFDLYLKLSDQNFVKILHQGEPFFENDAQRLSNKGIHELFIKSEDSEDFLALLENDIIRSDQNVSQVSFTLENLEAFEKVAKHLGWSPSVLVSAQKSVTHAVKILSKNPNILTVLKERIRSGPSPYGHHLGVLTYLVCAFGSAIGWIGESGQIKLALASLIHDFAVEDIYYNNIKEWNRKAMDSSDKSAATIKYRMHPFEATKIIKSLNSLMPDVEQIILQHHEVKDGSGFPRALNAGRIGQLPALFIIVEDLVEFIDNGENLETSITDFIMWGREFYDVGHFKKLFEAFEESLKS